jgi:FKBP-type peptidyl-prolyl cis-trans isomerase
MKKFIYLFLIGIVLQFPAASQGSNPCGKSWSQWTNVWNGQNAQVDYQLEFPSKSCGCGWKFVRIRHTFPHRTFVKIWLEGQDCDGKSMTSSFEAETMGGEISNDQGDWHSFKSVSGVAKVEIEYEDGGKKVKIVTTRSGTTRYINGMSEKAYNQQQQQKSTTSSTASTPRPSSGSGSSTSTTSTRTNQTTATQTASQRQAQSAEQQRLQREEAVRKQQEAERRQRDEAFRQNELRYQAQLQEITRKSEARAQRDAAIMDGFAGIVSILQKNKSERELREDANKRSSKLSEYKNKLAEGGYGLIDCPHCNLDGFDRCGQCRSKGSIKCSSCNGDAGKTCSSCSGTGKKGYGPYQVACFNCSGTGQRKCLPCGNQGSNICFLCDGRTEVQCGHCEGTGKMLERVSTSTSSNYSSSSTNTSYQTNNEYSNSRSMQEEQAADEKAKVLVATIKQGQDFLQKNKTKPGVKSTASGLQYQVVKPGNGRRFTLGDTITYHVRYSNINGALLYDTYTSKEPARHAFTGFSTGFDFAVEAFSMMPAGSRYKFFVPNQLAYKEREVPLTNGKIIQPGAALIVEYELLSVKRPVAEMLREEFILDSILYSSIEDEMVMSLTAVEPDSVFAISLIRNYDDINRNKIELVKNILYRESNGHYPIEMYGPKKSYYQEEEGSDARFYYIPTFAAYQKVVRELEARANKEGFRVFRRKDPIYLNEKPTKLSVSAGLSNSNNTEWSAKYDACRVLFDQGRYFECYQLAQSLSELTGRKNQKIQLLIAYAGYLSITNGKIDAVGDGLSPNHPMNYQNLSTLNSQIKDLLSLATPADSAATWLYHAKIYEYDTRSMAEDYRYQKDRTPEKAVRLLDSLESKFRKRPMWGSESSVFVLFSLKDSILTIIAEVSKEWRSKRIKDKYYRGELRINLKEVELTKVAINRSKDQISGDYIFTELPSVYHESIYNAIRLPVPALINGKNKSAMSYTLAEEGNEDKARKKISKATPMLLQTFNLFQFYNELDPRFKDEEADKKIEETFLYLIDYFKK